MIFVTVGTHEQPFTRLFEALERIAASAGEEILVQSGPGAFRFDRCKAVPYLSFEQMQERMKQARIVVCHGGPASIMQARMHGKRPIAVPRQARFGEHVDDHQVDFCRRLEREGLLTAVYDIERLKPALEAPAAAATAPDVASSRAELCRRLTEFTEGLR